MKYLEAEIFDVSPKQGRVLLKCEGEDGVLPIGVSPEQARYIKKGVGSETTMRPLTHDLFVEVLEENDLKINKLTIDDLRDGVYYAKLHLNNKVYDTRPSDGIALCVRTGSDIEVESSLFEAQSVELRKRNKN